MSTTPAVIEKPALTPEQEKAARKARYEAYRKKQGQPKLAVQAVSLKGKHFFWAPNPGTWKGDDSEMVRLDTLGYALVKEPKAKEILAGQDIKDRLVIAGGLRQDGTYVIGDVILTFCDQEVYDFHLLDVEERSDQLISGAQEDFKTEAARAGIPTFETTGRRKS